MKTVWNRLEKTCVLCLLYHIKKMSRMHEKLDLFISCKIAFMFKILYWDLLSIKHEMKITSYLSSFAIYDQRRIQRFILPIPMIISEDNEIFTVYFQTNR